MHRLLVIFLLAFIVGCSSSTEIFRNQEPIFAEAKTATVCELRSHRKANIGRVVRVTGTFVSNGMNFGFFQDLGCGDSSNSVALAAFDSPPPDSSVSQFDKHFFGLCRKHVYCTKSAKLDLVGKVSEDSEGFLQIGVLHIYSYELVPR